MAQPASPAMRTPDSPLRGARGFTYNTNTGNGVAHTANNTYADHDGNVYKYNPSSGWQQHSNSGWSQPIVELRQVVDGQHGVPHAARARHAGATSAPVDGAVARVAADGPIAQAAEALAVAASEAAAFGANIISSVVPTGGFSLSGGICGCGGESVSGESQILRSARSLRMTMWRLFFYRDAVGDLVVLLARDDVLLQQFVLAGIRAGGDDAIRARRRSRASPCSCDLEAEFRSSGLSALGRVRPSRHPLGDRLGIVFQLRSGCRGFLPKLVRTRGPGIAGVASGKKSAEPHPPPIASKNRSAYAYLWDANSECRIDSPEGYPKDKGRQGSDSRALRNSAAASGNRK